MKLPAHIDLQVVCDIESDLSNIIVEIEVSSGRKNPYHIYFPKTTSDGRARLTAEDFRGQFEDHWEAGLMDYNGSIESAHPVVTLRLFSTEGMLQSIGLVQVWPLLKYESRKWRSREEMIEYFLSCRNGEFHAAPQRAKIEENGVLQFRISKKAA